MAPRALASPLQDGEWTPLPRQWPLWERQWCHREGMFRVLPCFFLLSLLLSTMTCLIFSLLFPLLPSPFCFFEAIIFFFFKVWGSNPLKAHSDITVMATPRPPGFRFCIKSRKSLKGRAAWKGERNQVGPIRAGVGGRAEEQGGEKSVRPAGTRAETSPWAFAFRLQTRMCVCDRQQPAKENTGSQEIKFCFGKCTQLQFTGSFQNFV